MSHFWSSFLTYSVHDQSAQSAGLAGNGNFTQEKPSIGISQGGDPNKVTNPVPHPRICAPADISHAFGSREMSLHCGWYSHALCMMCFHSLELPHQFFAPWVLWVCGRRRCCHRKPQEVNWGAPQNSQHTLCESTPVFSSSVFIYLSVGYLSVG